MMKISVQTIHDSFAVLGPDLGVTTVPTRPGLYEALDQEFDQFRGHVLVAAHAFSEDWPGWERHPAGDEIVMLLSGKATMVLRTPDGDETVSLEDAGSYVVIPRGTWHTAHISEPTRMLFITPGEGTEHGESPGG